MGSREDIVKQSLEQDMPTDIIDLITQYDVPSAAVLLKVHGKVLDKAIKAWEDECSDCITHFSLVLQLQDRNFFCGKVSLSLPQFDQARLLSSYKSILEAIAKKASYTYTNGRLEHDSELYRYSGMNFEDPYQALKMILMGNPVVVFPLDKLKIENLCDVLEPIAAIITSDAHQNLRTLFEASCILAGYDLIYLSLDDAQLLSQELLEKNLITTTQVTNLQLSDTEQLKHFTQALHLLLVKEKSINKNLAYFRNKDLLLKAVDRSRYLYFNGKDCVMNVTVSEQQTINDILKKQASKQKRLDSSRPVPMSAMLAKGPVFSTISEPTQSSDHSDAEQSNNDRSFKGS